MASIILVAGKAPIRENQEAEEEEGRTFKDKPTCQVCGTVGHSGTNCYYRFDKAYMGQPPDENREEKASEKVERHNAYIGTPNSVRDPDWYFDSGASNHVTHDSDRFQDISKYDGKSSLMVGNGDRLKIVGFGTATLKSDQKSLDLHNILYVPKITKNLFSVSMLATNNNVVVEFDAHCCFVKDKVTATILL